MVLWSRNSSLLITNPRQHTTYLPLHAANKTVRSDGAKALTIQAPIPPHLHIVQPPYCPRYFIKEPDPSCTAPFLFNSRLVPCSARVSSDPVALEHRLSGIRLEHMESAMQSLYLAGAVISLLFTWTA